MGISEPPKGQQARRNQQLQRILEQNPEIADMFQDLNDLLGYLRTTVKSIQSTVGDLQNKLIQMAVRQDRGGVSAGEEEASSESAE